MELTQHAITILVLTFQLCLLIAGARIWWISWIDWKDSGDTRSVLAVMKSGWREIKREEGWVLIPFIL